MSQYTSTSQSRLLALPAELRLRIYDLALPAQVYLSRYIHSLTPVPLPSATAYEVRASHECPPPLMFVSKHVYQESKPLLLARLVLNLYGNIGPSITGRFTKLPVFGKISLPEVQHIKHVEIGWEEQSIQGIHIREVTGLKTLRIHVPAYLDSYLYAGKSALYGAYLGGSIDGQPFDLRNFLRAFCWRIYKRYGNGAFMNGKYKELASICDVYLQLPVKNISIQVDGWCILGAMWLAYNYLNHTVEFEITTAVVGHDPAAMFSYPGLLNITDEVVKQILRGNAESEYKYIDRVLDILIWKELLENQSERLPDYVLDVVRKDGGQHAFGSLLRTSAGKSS